jgi:hypothetical protein
MKAPTGNAAKRAAATERVRQHREALRAKGLRPVQVWIPDTRRPEITAEYRSQLQAIANDDRDREMLGWLEGIAYTDGWE